MAKESSGDFVCCLGGGGNGNGRDYKFLLHYLSYDPKNTHCPALPQYCLTHVDYKRGMARVKVKNTVRIFTPLILRRVDIKNKS